MADGGGLVGEKEKGAPGEQATLRGERWWASCLQECRSWSGGWQIRTEVGAKERKRYA